MMYAWIAKGFIVRADLKGLEMVTFLISMLGNEEMAEWSVHRIHYKL